MKRTMLLIALVISFLLINLSAYLFAQEEQTPTIKRRLAVFDFEDKTEHQVRWYTGQNVGRGMSDILMEYLHKSGRYDVIERQALNTIMEEQGLSVDDFGSSNAKISVGNLVGVEVGVFGAVTEFGFAKQNTDVNKKKGLKFGKINLKGVGVSKDKATVGVNVRFVDMNTGKLLASKSFRTEKSKKGLKLSVNDLNFNNRNSFDESLVGKAAKEAIQGVEKLLRGSLNNLPWQSVVAKANNAAVIIRAGSDCGLKVGDVLTVYRKKIIVDDPDETKIIYDTKKIGKIQVVKDLGGKASGCKVIAGAGFQKGDIVKIH